MLHLINSFIQLALFAMTVSLVILFIMYALLPLIGLAIGVIICVFLFNFGKAKING